MTRARSVCTNSVTGASLFTKTSATVKLLSNIPPRSAVLRLLTLVGFGRSTAERGSLEQRLLLFERVPPGCSFVGCACGRLRRTNAARNRRCGREERVLGPRQPGWKFGGYVRTDLPKEWTFGDSGVQRISPPRRYVLSSICVTFCVGLF